MRLDKRTLSPAAREVASITGIQTSFAQSSEVTLKKLCEFKISESDSEGLRKNRVAQWCHQLKHEGGLRIVRLLQELDVGVCSPSQRTAHADCLRCFQNHQHKLDYPRYVQNGWQSEQRAGRERVPDGGWAIVSKGTACAGAKPAPTPSATSALSTSVNPANGRGSGKIAPISYLLL